MDNPIKENLKFFFAYQGGSYKPYLITDEPHRGWCGREPSGWLEDFIESLPLRLMKGDNPPIYEIEINVTITEKQLEDISKNHEIRRYGRKIEV
jgi:hypothetical protein